MQRTLAAVAPIDGVHDAVPEQWDALAALDRAVAGVDRRALLYRLFAEEPAGVRVAQDDAAVRGFIAARTGSRAVQLGPCIAPPEVSPLLLVDAWGRYPGQRVYMDIPVDNPAATRLAEAQGLTVQRYLTRTARLAGGELRTGEGMNQAPGRVCEPWGSGPPGESLRARGLESIIAYERGPHCGHRAAR